MSKIIQVTDQTLMKVGDSAVFISTTPMAQEYRITVDKEYPAIIIRIRPRVETQVELTNDVGEIEIHEMEYGSFSGGYSRVIALLPVNVYRERVLDQHKVAVENALKDYLETVDKISQNFDAKLKFAE